MWARSWNESKSEEASCCSRRAQRLLAPRGGCSTCQTLPHRSHLKNTRDPLRTVARTLSGSAWQLRQKGFGCRVRDRRSSAIGEGITWWSRACRNSRGISSRLSMRTRFEIRGHLAAPTAAPRMGGNACELTGSRSGAVKGGSYYDARTFPLHISPRPPLCHASGCDGTANRRRLETGAHGPGVVDL